MTAPVPDLKPHVPPLAPDSECCACCDGVTAETPQDGWNNVTFPARHAGSEPIIEAWERVCVENNGPHGEVAAAP